MKNVFTLVPALLFMLTAVPADAATPVTVSNHSFELPDVPSGLSATLAQDWSVEAGSPRLGDDGWSNVDSTPDSADAGQFVGFGVNFYQILATTMAANTEYTLTVDIGDQTGAAVGSGAAIRLGTGSTYGNNLLAAFVVSNVIPVNGGGASDGWNTWVTTFGMGDGVVGEPLRIELLYDSGQTYFDNVRLTASNVTSLLEDVPLQNATADFSQSGFPVGNTIDDVIDSSGWAFSPNQGSAHDAVYETVSDLTKSTFTFIIHQRSGLELTGSLRFSVTTDDRSTFADGFSSGGDVTATWTQLVPLTAETESGTSGTINGDNTVDFADDNSAYLRVTTDKSAVGGITGIRMEVDPGGVNAVLTEFEVTARQEPAAAGSIAWSDETTTNITSSSALAIATLAADADNAVLVWDTSDQGTGDTGDWTYSNVLGATNAGSVSAQATNLQSDTSYTWRYYGTNATSEGWSLPITFSTALTAAQKPVFASATLPDWDTVSLTWQDNASNETAYLLQRSTNGTDFTLLTTLAADSTSYSDSAISAPGTYTYRLAATNATNGSATDFASCETNVTTTLPAGYIEVLNHSFELADIADNTFGGTPTSWAAGGFQLADGNGGNFPATPHSDGDQMVFSNGGDLHQVLGTNLEANTTYALTVDVGDRTQTSFGSPTLKLGTGSTLGADLLAATVVSNATPSNGGWSTWISTFTTGAGVVGDPLRVELSNTGVQTLLDNVRLISSALPGGTVVWSGESISGITATSADASATVSSDIDETVLVWDISDKGDTNTSDWTYSRSLGSTNAGAVSSQATNLQSDTQYTWRFYGTNASFDGWSAADTFWTALTAAQNPVFTSATVPSWNTVSLTWNDNAANESAYLLQRSTNGVDFTHLATLAANSTSYSDPAALTAGTYTYRLAATNAGNGSATAFAACQTSAVTPGPPDDQIFYDSFEDPDVTGLTNTDPTGWTGGGINDNDAGKFTTPFGSQAAWLNSGSMDTTATILPDVLLANYVYTLEFNVGKRNDLGGNYRVSLRAGTTELAFTTGTPTQTDFSESDQIVFTSDHSHTALLGQQLVIRLAIDTTLQPHWDNVTLRASPAPVSRFLFK